MSVAHMCELPVLLLLLSATAPRPAASTPDVQPAGVRVPPLPPWARGPDFRGSGQWKAFSVKRHAKNKAFMQATVAQGQRFDFLLYGDSITQIIGDQCEPEWAKQFPSGDGWRVAPMGVAGSDVEDLMWRVTEGGEAPPPHLAPRVVALLIGSNDVFAHTPVNRLDTYMNYLVSWFQASYPSTKIVIVKLLPRLDVGPAMWPVNRRYRGIAARRGLTWSTCGQFLNASDTSVLYDGTHPTPETGNYMLRCLAPLVRSLARPPPPVVSPPPAPPPPPNTSWLAVLIASLLAAILTSQQPASVPLAPAPTPPG